MISATIPEMLAVGFPALLFLYLVSRREWEWIGLYLALSFSISLWIKCNALFANLLSPSVPHQVTLGWAIVSSVMYFGGMLGAMRGPSTSRTLFIALAAMETLFVGIVPLYRFAFDLDQGAYFLINGQAVPNGLGATLIMIFAVVPTMIGIPWMLARQSASEKTIIAPALSRYGTLSGIGIVAFMVFSTCFVAWGYIGYGPFSGLPQRPAFPMERSLIGPNAVFGMLIGAVIFLFWIFPQRFFAPVVNLLEASQNVNSGPLEEIAHPLWREIARKLDESRREALESQRGRKIAEEWLEAFVSNAPVPMILADPANNRYLLANSVAAEFYDISAAELVASDPADAIQFWPRWEEDMAPAMRRALIDRQPQSVETLIMRKREGTVANYFVSLFPIVDETRKLPLLASVGIDITAIRQAESALAANKEALHQSEKLAALGQLLAGVAHELNNPLTVVVGRSAILQEKLAGSPHEKAIASLREAADRCNRIVKTFLAMARQAAPRRGAVQLNEVIEAALDMTAYGIRSSGIELDRHFAPNLPDVDADEDQLVQVLTNLLLNAQHALEGYDRERTIRIATRAAKGQVVVTIADSGPGVPVELQSRIFEPFFTTKEVGQGTGMGLALARGMIEEHGGTLSYAEAEGGGARFEIALPVSGSAHAEETMTHTPEPASNARGRVLIVDDEEPIRSMLAEILMLSRLDCIEAATGRAALDLLATGEFDLIFCDVRMPELDGIGLRRELAAMRPDLLDRLVFMSGDVLQRERARYAEIRDHIFIEKPFDPAEVRRIAADILDRKGANL